MRRAFEIVIVGGGVTGLALAAKLLSMEHTDALRITLLDAAPRPSFSVDSRWASTRDAACAAPNPAATMIFTVWLSSSARPVCRAICSGMS